MCAQKENTLECWMLTALAEDYLHCAPDLHPIVISLTCITAAFQCGVGQKMFILSGTVYTVHGMPIAIADIQESSNQPFKFLIDLPATMK